MANRYTAQEVALALKESRGFVTGAARKLQCSRRTIYRYLKESASVQEALADSREERHDFVENKLMTAIDEGNVTAIIFYLKTQCKDRGYIERTEHTGESGGAIRIEYVNDWRARADDSAT